MLEVSWVGGHLDLSDDAHINVDVSIAEEIRDAFSSTSLSEVQVFDSLDVVDAVKLKACAVQVSLASGPSWESSTVREVNVPSSFELLIRVLAPAERAALLSARTILRMAVEAVVDAPSATGGVSAGGLPRA